MSKTMRSYSSEDLNRFRKILGEKGVSLSQQELTKVIGVYHDFLKDELLKGKSIYLSKIGTIESKVRKMSLLGNTSDGKRRVAYKYVFSLKPIRSLKTDMNTRFKAAQTESNKQANWERFQKIKDNLKR